jgi:hypothetical protein
MPSEVGKQHVNHIVIDPHMVHKHYSSYRYKMLQIDG